ncbi:MAG: SRPBCC family protein [Frankiaceae bacterium]|nr:SRPBCC family protein [Frankiaceae bacterium]
MATSVTDSIVVNADPATVFDVLVDPAQHPLFDGSDTLRGNVSGPPRLYLGARFSMRMRWGAPYVITNAVVEYDEDRRVAWRHFARHVWRYELEPVDGAATRVVETFDYGRAPLARLYGALGFVRNAETAIPATLQRLKVLVEGRAVAAPTR